MVLSFDLDDVLVSFQDGWIEFNKKYNVELVYEDYTDFDYSMIMKIPMEEVFRRIFEFYETDIFRNLKPVEGAQDTIQQLSKKHTLYVLTSRTPEIRKESETWLAEHFPGMFKEVLYTGQISRGGFDKKIGKVDLCLEHGVTFHVDDAPMHVPPLVEKGIKVAVLETPWNRASVFDSPLITRIQKMPELLQLL